MGIIKRLFTVWRTHGLEMLVERSFSYINWKTGFDPRPTLLYARYISSTQPRVEPIWVDPCKIKHQNIYSGVTAPGTVYSGRWDKSKKPFDERYQVQSLIRHFKHGVAWSHTKYYQNAINKIRNGRRWRGCENTEDVESFFNRLDRLYNSIQTEGYKSQTELLAEKPDKTRKLNNDAPRVELNEICVNIARDGEILWRRRGQHRLCIAQILQLPKVPVLVLVRHKKWQEVRKEMERANSQSEIPDNQKQYLSHPDIANIAPPDSNHDP